MEIRRYPRHPAESGRQPSRILRLPCRTDAPQGLQGLDEPPAAQQRRKVLIVFVTSFLGAVMLVSGLAALVMTVPTLYSTLRVMASYTVIVAPFAVLVPTVMSCFYQISELRKMNMVV